MGRSSPLEGWLGVAASGFFPLGDWAEHPYAGTLAPRDLTFFGPGPGAAVEGGFKYKRALFSLRFDFANLTTGAWEEFARQHGNEVHSRAYLFALHVSVFYRLLALRRFHLDLGLGLGYAQGAGSETDSTRALDYGYSFFSPTFSFRQSLAVGLQLHRSIDLLLMLDHTVSAQSGVEYGQEEAGPLWGITLGLGARFWFGRSKE